MSPLELFTGAGDTLAERMQAAIQAEALEGLVKAAKKQVRTALEDAVASESERTGTSFTARLDGWSAQLTDPQPKPHVTDREVFVGWWVAEGFDHQTVERVEVTDHVRLATTIAIIMDDSAGDGSRLRTGADAEHLEQILVESAKVVTEHVLPEKALDSLTADARFVVTDGGLVDTATGEHVPGVECSRTAPQLRLVPKDKTVRLSAQREVASRLGVAPELLGGDAT